MAEETQIDETGAVVEEPEVTTKVKRADPKATQDESPELDAEVAASLPEDKYRGHDWGHLPNYDCPFCPYQTLDGSADVESHVRHRHLDRYGELDAAGKLKEAEIA